MNECQYLFSTVKFLSIYMRHCLKSSSFTSNTILPGNEVEMYRVYSWGVCKGMADMSFADKDLDFRAHVTINCVLGLRSLVVLVIAISDCACGHNHFCFITKGKT